MNKNNIIWIIIVVVIVIIFIIIISLWATGVFNKKTPSNINSKLTSLNNDDSYDVLLYSMATKQSLLSLLYKFLNSNIDLDFISLSDLDISDIYGDSSINDKNSIGYKNLEENKLSLKDESQILQKYSEIRYKNDYNAVSLKLGIPITPPIYIKGDNISAYIRRYKRFKDGLSFYYIQIKNNESSNVLDINGYKRLINILDYIKNKYQDNYLFSGGFGIHGYETAFKQIFKNSLVVVDMYKTMTRNNELGLYSPDGLAVSKNLYSNVSYKIDFFPGDNQSSFIVYYYLNNKSDNLYTTDSKMKNYINFIKENTNRPNYINNNGNYSEQITNITGFTEQEFKNLVVDIGSKIYKYENLPFKLGQIEVM